MPLWLSFIIIMTKKTSRIGKIPTFVKKLTQILDDPAFTEMISWLPEENGFQILSVSSFAEKVLPKYFKHNNMASFVRQLNMYGFNRPKQSNQNVYIHSRFQKGNLNNMKFIKRKPSYGKESGDENQQDSSEPNKVQMENFQKQIMIQYEKLLVENEELKKQNQELNAKVGQFQQLKQKLKRCTQQMNRCFLLSLDDSDNDKTQKQTNQSNSSSDKSSVNMKQHFKSGFSVCRKNNQNSHQLSYQILLQGSPKVEQMQK